MAVLERIASDDTALRHRALERQARDRLNRIEEIRDVALLAWRGLSQRAIAERLNTSQPRIGRIQKLLELRNGDVEETPEEIIVRATVEHTNRRALVETLKGLTYTFGEQAPYPMEGSTTGTWDDVVDAHFEGLLSDAEYEEVRAAVRG
jgi:hypothetical protein